MLKHLHVQNFALIPELSLDLDQGFLAITGETGSGKSILLGALNLILGERADYSVIRDQEKKTVVEAVFELDQRMSVFFESNDIDFDTETVIRREISAQGKSRAFINDTPVSLQVLKELTEQLIYIHSQHETLSIRKSDFQFNLLDTIGNSADQFMTYQAQYRKWKTKLSWLEKAENERNQFLKELEFNQFLFNEISELNLDVTDYAALDLELQSANNIDARKQVLEALVQGIGGEDATMDRIQAIKAFLDRNGKDDPLLDEMKSRLMGVIAELEELEKDAQRALERVDMNPERMQELTQALDKFNRLLLKHRLSNQHELMDLGSQLEQSISRTESLTDDIELARDEIKVMEKELMLQSKALFQARSSAAQLLKNQIEAQLAQLKMPDAKVGFDLVATTELNADGGMAIDLLFSANPGMPLKSIQKAGSGGELSRLMLVLQSILSEKKGLPTLVLDEIDTGVSGDVAQRIGRLLHQMGANIQLLVVTHLPQVAALAQAHFEVKKEQAITSINRLTAADSDFAIAKMLSGDNVTTPALNNAKALRVLN